MKVWKSLDIIVKCFDMKRSVVCNNIDWWFINPYIICAYRIIHLDRYFSLFVRFCSATRWILTKSSRCDRILRVYNAIGVWSWARSILLLMQCVIESKYIGLQSRQIVEYPQKGLLVIITCILISQHLFALLLYRWYHPDYLPAHQLHHHFHLIQVWTPYPACNSHSQCTVRVALHMVRNIQHAVHVIRVCRRIH